MARRSLLVVVPVVATLAGTACGGDGPEDLPWNQISSDKTNSGFNAVRTAPTNSTSKKWVAPVGELAFSSPVIGTDGTLYIGNLAGQAMALNADGSERWRRRLGSAIVSAPAVHVESGEIVFVVQHPLSDRTFLSFLYVLTPSGNIHRVSTEQNLVSTAAPKIWGNYIFLTGKGSLYVFRWDTLDLVVKEFYATRCGLAPCTDGGFWLGELLSGLGCSLTFHLPEDCFPPATLGYQGPRHEPSVAIVDSPTAVDDAYHPIVIATAGSCAIAWRFSSRAQPSPQLELLWEHRLRHGDCPNSGRPTSPAVIVGNQAVFADANGLVTSLDARTGKELWKRFRLGQPVRGFSAPPVALLRQIYLVTEATLLVLDSDGTDIVEVGFQGVGQGAALSLNHVHVTTTEGVYTFDLDPHNAAIFDSSTASPTHGGFRMHGLALGEDGTVYVSTPSGSIHAYGPSPR